DTPCYITAKIQNSITSTTIKSGLHPEFNKELVFEINRPYSGILLELYIKESMYDVIIGNYFLPIAYLPFYSEKSIILNKRFNKTVVYDKNKEIIGTRCPSPHQLSFEAYIEVPENLTKYQKRCISDILKESKNIIKNVDIKNDKLHYNNSQSVEYEDENIYLKKYSTDKSASDISEIIKLRKGSWGRSKAFDCELTYEMVNDSIQSLEEEIQTLFQEDNEDYESDTTNGINEISETNVFYKNENINQDALIKRRKSFPDCSLLLKRKSISYQGKKKGKILPSHKSDLDVSQQNYENTIINYDIDQNIENFKNKVSCESQESNETSDYPTYDNEVDYDYNDKSQIETQFSKDLYDITQKQNVLNSKKLWKSAFNEISTRNRHTQITDTDDFTDPTEMFNRNIKLEAIRRKSKKNTNVQSFSPISNKNIYVVNDAELCYHVYLKTIQALIYPISNSTPHKFNVYSAKSPTYCSECEGLLWGLMRQGLKCEQCSVKCHIKCKDMVNADCFIRLNEKKFKKGKATLDQAPFLKTMRLKMDDTEKTKNKLFEIIRDMFKQSKEEHMKTLLTVKKKIQDGTLKWTSKIVVTVLCAQGLIAKDKTGKSDPYVTVTIGKVKKRTKTIPHNLNPVWNEKFFYESTNSTDKIKVRVWDEDNDLRSKMRSKLIREADDFLGQVIIDFKTLSGEMVVWYNLEKRTNRSAVSGAIKLKINVEIEGEEQMAPYHVQYTFLHETIFNYMIEIGEEDKVIIDYSDKDWNVFMTEELQDIINEFSMRYGIEHIFQAMTHFACLTAKYATPRVSQIISTLLANINRFYSSSVTNGSATDRFGASNFGKEKFIKLLDHLHNQLRIDLSVYRNTFPSNDEQRLTDLKASVDILTSITFFRMKIQKLATPPKPGIVVMDCVRACIESTYRYLFDNCPEIFMQEFTENDNTATELEIAPNPSYLKFWEHLIDLIISTIDEDKNKYMKVINQFPSIFQISELSVSILWNLYSLDLKQALTGTEIKNIHRPVDYINLLFKVKSFYQTYVVNITEPSTKKPEYPMYFEKYVINWLNENNTTSIEYLASAYKRDIKENLKQASDQSKFSCSVTDIFTQLNQLFNIVAQLECSQPELNAKYNKYFSDTISNVLLKYLSYIKNDFKNYIKNIEKACILMNNLQECRVQLENIFSSMGGKELQKDTCDQLDNLQTTLTISIDQLAQTYTEKYKLSINDCMPDIQSQIVNFKEPNAKTKDNAAGIGLKIISKLMGLLHDTLADHADVCDKFIFKRFLKELWKIVCTSIEYKIVLPPLPDVRQPIIPPGNAQAKVEGLSNHIMNTVGQDISKKDTSGFTAFQCSILDSSLDTLKTYFYGNGMGIKKIYLDNSPELRSLRYALKLYTQTTDTLIKTFVSYQSHQIDHTHGMNCGEISLQVDLYTHPGNGNHKISIKILNCRNLKWHITSMFRPFVLLSLTGPSTFNKSRSKASKTGNSSLNPEFDEMIIFNIGSEAELKNFELQMNVKDYCFGRSDDNVGIGLIQLKNILDQGSCACTCILVKELCFDSVGMSILRILSKRNNDKNACEFLNRKMDRRKNS
ncbi:Munc13-2, partial [Intoshia linei]